MLLAFGTKNSVAEGPSQFVLESSVSPATLQTSSEHAGGAAAYDVAEV